MITHATELVRFSSDAALAIDINARIVAWNAPAQRLLGYTASEAVGSHCGDVLQATLPDGQPLCHSSCNVFQCFGECQPHGLSSCRLRHRDGQWVSASIASIAMSERARRLYADEIISVFLIRDASPASPSSRPRTLHVFTLGGFRLAIGDRGIDTGKWRRKQSLMLLKYLLAKLDRPVHGERLLDFLWPDTDERLAKGRLKVTLHDLRRELRLNGLKDTVIETVGNTYRLKRDMVCVDADAFQHQVAEACLLEQQRRWSEALEYFVAARCLYRGDYLEEEPYAAWCATDRDRLKTLYLESLSRAANCHSQLGQFTAAVNLCRKALFMDPCLEEFHYALMEYLARNGQPELAVAQYHQCEKFLAREFDTAPLPRTRRLYLKIIEQS